MAEMRLKWKWIGIGIGLISISMLVGCAEESGADPVSPPTEEPGETNPVEPADDPRKRRNPRAWRTRFR